MPYRTSLQTAALIGLNVTSTSSVTDFLMLTKEASDFALSDQSSNCGVDRSKCHFYKLSDRYARAYANVTGAHLPVAKFDSATYNSKTIFPSGFNPEKFNMVFQKG